MKRHVALIVETSSVYGRDLLSGIVRFMRMHDDWSVFLEQRDLWKKPPAWLNEWQGDGIISRATTPKLLEAVSRTDVPLVEVTDRRGDTDWPQVRSDDAAIGRMAAAHLLERGFRRFGFCGFKGEAWSRRREGAFVKTIRSITDMPCLCFNSSWHGPTPQEEIRHVQIKRAKELLLTTDLSAERIATLCGFEHPEYLLVVFKRMTGQTTTEYRKQAKP